MTDQRPIKGETRGVGGVRPWMAPAVVSLVFLALTLPLALLDVKGSNEAADQDRYHLPIIRTFASDWNDRRSIDLVNYESATAPGYHLLMAAVQIATGSDVVMRALNVALGLALILVGWFGAARFAGPWRAVVLISPLAFSPYILGGTVWLTTDVTALLLVAMAIGGVALCEKPTRFGLLRAGVFAMLAASVRQIHVWTAGPIGLAAALASPLVAFAPAVMKSKGDVAPERSSWVNLVVGGTAALLPVALVGMFVWMWGGLTPNATGHITHHDSGPNWATPAIGLSFVAVLGVFYAPLAWREIARLRLHDVGALVCAGVGLVLALATETAYQHPERALGWFWKFVELLPNIGGRSIVITGMAPIGAILALCLYRNARSAGRSRAALLLTLALGLWLCAQTANSMAWQRYFEPMSLLGVAWLAAMGMRGRDESAIDRWALAGPLTLGLAELALSAITMYREAALDLMSGS